MRAPSLLLLVLAASCAARTRPPPPPAAPEPWTDPEALLPAGARPFQRTTPRALAGPARPAGGTVALRHGVVLTATGKRIDDGTVVFSGGKLVAVGDAATPIPEGARVVDLGGRFVTPGLIDSHSHIGVYPNPDALAHEDGNESTGLMTPAADAAGAYFAQDPSIPRALAGGVVAAQILPGSSNLIGGTSFVAEMRPGRTVDEIAFPGAPRGLKMACGENPKRGYKDKGGPKTRMGLYPTLRKQFQKARDYQLKLDEYRRDRQRWEEKRAQGGKPAAAPTPPGRDDDLEVLAAVLRGEILVHIHCYRAGEHLEMLAIADEFGFPIRSFHHALEAYKVRDRLAPRGIAISTWADWWGFKLESFDGIPENAALYQESGGRVIIHSDSAISIQRLNQEAAKALAAGRAAGVKLTDDDALRWVTIHPAWALGIDEVTGTLEPGKRADVVVWSGDPLSVYARAELVFVAGELAYDRKAGRPVTDLELGNGATR